MNAKTDADEPATGRWVAGRVRNAIDAIKAIATTGDDKCDADLLLAEQALRRVYDATKKSPD
jgi:hypothetical protein